MKKRTSLFVILLSAFLMVSMMSAMAFAKDKNKAQTHERAEKQSVKTESISAQEKDISIQEKDDEYYPIWIDGAQVSKTNPRGTGWTYSQEGIEGTLTLTRADITGINDITGENSNIYSEGINLTIVLDGKNNTVGSSTPGSSADYAIDIANNAKVEGAGNLTIQGSGDLTVNGDDTAIWTYSDCKIESGEVTANAIENIAILPNSGDFVMSGGQVTAKSTNINAVWAENINITGGTVEAEVTDGNQANALYAEQDITIGKDVTAVTATVTCKESVNYGCWGICADDGNVTINGGEITATVHNAIGVDNNGSGAIYADESVIIGGGNVTAEINCANGAEACSGICANNGNVEISGGTVEANVNFEGGNTLDDCDAIYADEDISITGGMVTASVTGGMFVCDAIYAEKGDVSINGDGTEVTATTDDNYAIYGENVSVENGADVTATSQDDCAIVANSNNSKIEIKGSTVRADGDGDALNAYGVTVDNSIVTAKGSQSAIKAYEDVLIKDSKMNDDKASGQIYTDKVLTIQDSRVKTDYATNVLYGVNGINIIYTENGKYDTYVEAKATDVANAYAIITEKEKLSIDNNLGITKPEGGVSGIYEDMSTVMYNGTPASHVIIQAKKHDITIAETTGGKVKVEPEQAAEGEEVKVTATPDAGNVVDKIIVIDADGKETDITNRGSFTMGSSNVTVKVTFKKSSTDLLLMTMKAAKKKKMVFSWNTISGADGYEVFLARCNRKGKKYNYVSVATVDANTLTYTKAGLKKGVNYKAYVKAFVMKDGVKTYIKKSPTVHAIGGGYSWRFTNPKSVKVKKTNIAVRAGKTSKIKASVRKLRKSKRLISKKHAPKLRYLSSNPAVATVTGKGTVTGVSAGSCKVYVFAANGVKKTVNVTVQ